MRTLCHGLTLMELIVSLAIASILTFYALPNLSDWFSRQEARSTALRLIQLVQYARVQAIDAYRPVIICGGSGAARCSDDWNQGVLMFIDENLDGELDPEDRLLMQYPPLSTNGTVTWRAAFGKPYFRALPTGRISFTGSFIFCPGNGDSRYASMVIVNAAGRPRIARDSDGDGVVENAEGKPILCSPGTED